MGYSDSAWLILVEWRGCQTANGIFFDAGSDTMPAKGSES
jgi:hypothetical protein